MVIDDALINLGTSTGAGLSAQNPTADPAPRTIIANHLTSSGAAPARVGVLADATLATATADVDGHADQLHRARPRHLDPGGRRQQRLARREQHRVGRHHYTDYQDSEDGVGDGTATTTFGDGNLSTSTPLPGSGGRQLSPCTAASRSSTRATAGTAAPAVDRNGDPRVFDGDGNGSPVPDMGAYELVDVTAPKTSITAGPTGQTNDNTPVFTFRSDPGATFECRIDGGAFQPCTQPRHHDPAARRAALLHRPGHGSGLQRRGEPADPHASPSTRSRRTPGSPRRRPSASSRRR